MNDLVPYPALVRAEKKRFVAAFNALALSKSTEVDAVKLNAYFSTLSRRRRSGPRRRGL